MTTYSRSRRGASTIQKGQHDDLTAHVNRRLSSSANSWSSPAHQLAKGCTMNTLHPACKVTLVRKTSAKCDFSQAMLSIAYKLNCTLQSEMHDVTVRSHAHSAGEYASEVERTAPCYSSERGDLDRLFEMSHDIVSDTPKHVFAQQSASWARITARPAGSQNWISRSRRSPARRFRRSREA